MICSLVKSLEMDIPMKITGSSCPERIISFSEAQAQLADLLMTNITKSRYTIPTVIQEHAIPIILAGRDIMGCAQTGSGKTAAFLIPIIERLLVVGATAEQTVDQAGICYPEVVVMSPTRELAMQIKDEARKFCSGSRQQEQCGRSSLRAVKVGLRREGRGGRGRRHMTSALTISQNTFAALA